MARRIWFSWLISLLLSACGGGAGTSTETSTGGGAGTSNQTSIADRLVLQANLADAEYLALGSSVVNATTIANATPRSWLARVIDWVIAPAYANTRKSTNLLAFRADGTPIENPLTSAVDFIIGGLTIDPSGQYIYLGIEDHQNLWNPEWAALPGPLCSLYKITKATGSVACLSNSDTYSPYSPVGNQFAVGNATESFIKFDAEGNGYFIAFDWTPATADVLMPGTHSQRLIKMTPNGQLSTYRDPTGWYARNLAYGPQGQLYYSEVSTDENQAQMRSYFLDPITNTFAEMPGASDSFLAGVVSTVDGNLYVTNSQRLERWNALNSTFEVVLDEKPIQWLQRDAYGGANVLLDDGSMYHFNGGSRQHLGQIGPLLASTYKNDASDIIYPKIGAGRDHLVAVGSTDTGLHQVCVWSKLSWAQRCQALGPTQPSLLAVTAVGDRAMIFWNNGGTFLQTDFDMDQFLSGDEEAKLENSEYADGSILSAITTRPALAFKAEMERVKTTVQAETIAAAYWAPEEYSWLTFTPASSDDLKGVDVSQLRLLDSAGNEVTNASFEILGTAFAVHVSDETRLSTFAQVNADDVKQWILSDGVNEPWGNPVVNNEIGWFPQSRQITVFRVTFDASVRLLDLDELTVRNANGIDESVEITLTHGGDTLEIKAKDDTLTVDAQPYRLLSPGTTWTLQLPERVRLPAQVFTSPFESTSIQLTVGQ